jgi:isopropylmalate/homocitrate/citramalate synthase
MLHEKLHTQLSRELLDDKRLRNGDRMEENFRVRMDDKTNLLELEEQIYHLVDVEEPNVFRNLFPYNEVPKIAFNDRIVPHCMPKNIWITDTTFRDGQQSRTPYKTEQIVRMYDYLHQLGGPKGIIRQSEFFLYSKKDRDAVYKCLERGYEFPEVTSWIRASQKDFELVKEIGLKETGILVSCSDYHIFYKMKMTRRQCMEHYLNIVRQCMEHGISPRCHLEDITRSDIHGFVIPFCLELMKLQDIYKIPVKIRACDTMGYGVNFSGAVIPRSVQGIIYGIRSHADVPSEQLEWHGHNDFYKAVTNSTTAWLYGASGVNCSLFGIGERTGNTPLEAMVFEYAQLKGTFDGMEPRVITELAEYYQKEVGYEIPAQTPFVGKNFNVTRAGIHADGLLKNEEIYNIFDTEKILNRPVLVAVSNTSGLAGIAHWMNTYFRLPDEEKIDKNCELVALVKKWVDKEYEDDRVTVLTDEELVETIEASCKQLNIPMLYKHSKQA